MAAALIRLGVVILLFASWLYLHGLLVLRVLRSELPRAQRLLALLPPCTPVLAWRVGAQKRTVLWCVLLLGYAITMLLPG